MSNLMSVIARTIAWSVLLNVLNRSTADEPKDYLKQPADWFATDEARQVAATILSWQSEPGGWPKNEDTTRSPYEGDRRKLKPTYDNGATTDELRFLARMYNATHDAVYHTAFNRGLDYVFRGQYPSGGWPQFHPPGDGYHRHITFNDNAMVRLLEFVREVATDDNYAFVDDAAGRLLLRRSTAASTAS